MDARLQDIKLGGQTTLLLTLEAASLLRVHNETIRAWIRTKRLKAIKFGRTWRVPIKEVERVALEGI